MNKDELIQYATDNGVEVTESMTKKQIAEAIVADDVELPEAIAKEMEKGQSTDNKTAKTAPVLLHRDYWDEDGTRHKKGSVVKVDVETAKTLIKEEKAERADPLPGEDG